MLALETTVTYDKLLTLFAFEFKLRRYMRVMSAESELDPAAAEGNRVCAVVGQCRLTVSKPVLKAPMVSALETRI